MIRKLRNEDVEAVMDIWLYGNIQAHGCTLTEKNSYKPLID